uniref:Uncharacterized protein n=1 Tax=Rhizophora mucronata TaxID=61149 RepID=A0A2P2NKG9_RHIMU
MDLCSRDTERKKLMMKMVLWRLPEPGRPSGLSPLRLRTLL